MTFLLSNIRNTGACPIGLRTPRSQSPPQTQSSPLIWTALQRLSPRAVDTEAWVQQQLSWHWHGTQVAHPIQQPLDPEPQQTVLPNASVSSTSAQRTSIANVPLRHPIPQRPGPRVSDWVQFLEAQHCNEAPSTPNDAPPILQTPQVRPPLPLRRPIPRPTLQELEAYWCDTEERRIELPSPYWSDNERLVFAPLVELFGLDFEAIARYLGTKTTIMVTSAP